MKWAYPLVAIAQLRRYETCGELAREARSALRISGEFVGIAASAANRRRLPLAAGIVVIL